MVAKRKKKNPKRAHARTSKSTAKPSPRAKAEHATSRKTHRGAARQAKTRHHHRCAMCNHAASHVKGQGCLHFDGKRFCTCKHRA
jgi:hypothetical protein